MSITPATPDNPIIDLELSEKVVSVLLDVFYKELNRLYLTDGNRNLMLIRHLLETYINRKWVSLQTQFVIEKDANTILTDSLFRDFVLNLTTRFMTNILPYGSDVMQKIVQWRVEAASTYTPPYGQPGFDASPENDFSLLNPELRSTLLCDRTEYENILSCNPWLVVYGLLLENLPVDDLTTQLVARETKEPKENGSSPATKTTQ